MVAERVGVEVEDVSHDDVDRMWNCMASTIREVAKESLGVAVGNLRGHKSSRESWWLSDEVQTKVAVKQLRFRELITMRDGTLADRTRAEESYRVAKREAKKAVARAKEKAYEGLYRKLDSKEVANDIYRIAKARERRKKDLDSIIFIKDEVGRTMVKEVDIRKRWEEYFSSLFDGRGSRSHDETEDSVLRHYQNYSFCQRIHHEEVRLALRKMGRNKSVGPDQIPI
ncbi:uncharacterized protein [Rutidosis leptorrhynchoides]|uniref:uncharacterized protein n=1 Tax=Rutidosis leptorrhynchoides TaxID=125765 RepID=UPI003A9963DD